MLALFSTKRKGGDVSELARMLIAETSAAKSAPEMAQIVWVALNRARNRGVSPGSVVSPDLETGIWNNGALYRQRYESAHVHKNFPKAKAFVQEVLAGMHPQTIGNRKGFVHPAAMPVPPCASNRIEYQGRCLPHWATVNPVKVGGALFA